MRTISHSLAPRAALCRGFTLIELLTAVSIISILSAIALPQFASYRARGFDCQARVALRTVAIAEEAYYNDASTYASCDQATCPTTLPALDDFPLGLTLAFTGTASGFTGNSSHSQGTGEVFFWNP